LKVAHDMTLEDGTVWPLPIILDVDNQLAAELEPDRKAGLESPNGELIGFIDVDEVYRQNKKEIAHSIFGTEDTSHPGVENYLQMDDFLVGGSIKLFDEYRYNESDLLPQESRVLFDSKGWETVVGFQTRNAPHRAHEYIQKAALEHVDGILIQPKLGDKKEGDYRDDVIIGGYDKLIDGYYPDDLAVLSVFPSVMRYAGPREAVFDSIIRKNQGCTHFVIGRDHAGVGDFYGGFDAHRIFDDISDIGVEPLFFNYSFFCEKCDGMTSEKVCPHGDDVRVYPSGSKIREMIRSGEEPSEKIMRPEVANFIIEAEEPFVGGKV
jgi:sulfate adenylyltransferase